MLDADLTRLHVQASKSALQPHPFKSRRTELDADLLARARLLLFLAPPLLNVALQPQVVLLPLGLLARYNPGLGFQAPVTWPLQAESYGLIRQWITPNMSATTG